MEPVGNFSKHIKKYRAMILFSKSFFLEVLLLLEVFIGIHDNVNLELLKQKEDTRACKIEEWAGDMMRVIFMRILTMTESDPIAIAAENQVVVIVNLQRPI